MRDNTFSIGDRVVVIDNYIIYKDKTGTITGLRPYFGNALAISGNTLAMIAFDDGTRETEMFTYRLRLLEPEEIDLGEYSDY